MLKISYKYFIFFEIFYLKEMLKFVYNLDVLVLIILLLFVKNYKFVCIFIKGF